MSGDTVGTLRQFERAERARFLAGAPDVTAADYDGAYPPGCRLQEWVAAVFTAARNGHVLPPRVLDDLCRRAGLRVYRSLRHDHPNAVPKNYLSPAIRQHNAEHEAGVRAARRSGRAAAQAVTP